MEKEGDSTASFAQHSNPQSPAISVIVDVWAHNFRREIARLSSLIQQYPVVAFDTEFPGIINETGDAAANGTYFTYDVVKRSVEQTNVIQVGITLSDTEGQLPTDTCTWQFHLRYDLDKEQHAAVSIDLLKEAGIDFAKHKLTGIPLSLFGEYLTTSGLVLTDEVQWVCFHGLFDFAYLLKLLTGEPRLPADEYQFQEVLHVFFPHVFDVKTMAAPWSHLQGGLSKLCQDLGVKRIGTQHQAGSDSLVTAAAFFKLKQDLYNGCDKNKLEEVHNVLYGLMNEQEEAWDGRVCCDASIGYSTTIVPGPYMYHTSMDCMKIGLVPAKTGCVVTAAN